MRCLTICLAVFVGFLSLHVNAQQLSAKYIHCSESLFADLFPNTDGKKMDCLDGFDTSCCAFDQLGTRKHTFYKYGCRRPEDSITLSATEVKFIQDALLANTKRAWDTSYVSAHLRFLSSQYIDSIAAIERHMHPEYPETSPFFYAHFSGKRLLSVSHPVFLRNNTVCVFRYCMFSASGTFGTMDIYLKKENRWQVVGELGSFMECR